MPALLLTLLFWCAIAASVVAQVMILRSTATALRHAPPRSPAVEWGFAIGPALVLALALVLAWRAAMHPPTHRMEIMPAPGEIRS